MERILFIDQDGEKLLIVKDMSNFIMPRIGEDVICLKMFLSVKNITHNYDSKEIEIEVERQ